MKRTKNKRIQLKATRGLHERQLRKAAGGMLWVSCSKTNKHADCKQLTVVIGVHQTLKIETSSKLQSFQA